MPPSRVEHRRAIASRSKPDSTSITMARAAFAAMCQPSSGTRVSSDRPVRPVEHGTRCTAASPRARSRRQSASISPGVDGSDRRPGCATRSTTRAPHSVSSDDDAAAGAVGLEQLELRLEVLLHVGVVVEVVVAEVGERRRRRRRGRRPGACVSAWARDLDGDRAHLGLAHAGEQGVQLAGLRRGQAAGDRARRRCGARPSS